VSKRGVSPSFKILPLSLFKERGSKGVRLVNNLFYTNLDSSGKVG